ncbi:hypothetical protein Cs7R123_44630 [Catellatospora sp. TT07R-123]|nr:hypothetical protein Cs7R123_44630 [Catellatospora sp. TT07R-123]
MTAIAAIIGALLVAGSGVAYASGISQTGTQSSVQIFTGDPVAWTINTVATWSDVPSTTVQVVVPAGTNRIVDARFSAESLCAGTATAWCAVRIIVVNNATGTVTEFSPVAGVDFKFDTPGTSEQARSFERFSPSLGPGNYSIKAQALRMSGITTLTLDDYVLAVNVVNP